SHPLAGMFFHKPLSSDIIGASPPDAFESFDHRPLGLSPTVTKCYFSHCSDSLQLEETILNSSPNQAAAAAGATAKISELVCKVGFQDLDAATIAMVKRLVMDGIAVAIAGSTETPPKLLAEYVRDLGCRPQASVWGADFKTTAAYAAYVNAASMHVL